MRFRNMLKMIITIMIITSLELVGFNCKAAQAPTSYRFIVVGAPGIYLSHSGRADGDSDSVDVWFNGLHKNKQVVWMTDSASRFALINSGANIIRGSATDDLAKMIGDEQTSLNYSTSDTLQISVATGYTLMTEDDIKEIAYNAIRDRYAAPDAVRPGDNRLANTYEDFLKNPQNGKLVIHRAVVTRPEKQATDIYAKYTSTGWQVSNEDETIDMGDWVMAENALRLEGDAILNDRAFVNGKTAIKENGNMGIAVSAQKVWNAGTGANANSESNHTGAILFYKVIELQLPGYSGTSGAADIDCYTIDASPQLSIDKTIPEKAVKNYKNASSGTMSVTIDEMSISHTGNVTYNDAGADGKPQSLTVKGSAKLKAYTTDKIKENNLRDLSEITSTKGKEDYYSTFDDIVSEQPNSGMLNLGEYEIDLAEGASSIEMKIGSGKDEYEFETTDTGSKYMNLEKVDINNPVLYGYSYSYLIANRSESYDMFASTTYQLPSGLSNVKPEATDILFDRNSTNDNEVEKLYKDKVYELEARYTDYEADIRKVEIKVLDNRRAVVYEGVVERAGDLGVITDDTIEAIINSKLNNSSLASNSDKITIDWGTIKFKESGNYTIVSKVYDCYSLGGDLSDVEGASDEPSVYTTNVTVIGDGNHPPKAVITSDAVAIVGDIFALSQNDTDLDGLTDLYEYQWKLTDINIDISSNSSDISWKSSGVINKGGLSSFHHWYEGIDEKEFTRKLERAYGTFKVTSDMKPKFTIEHTVKDCNGNTDIATLEVEVVDKIVKPVLRFKAEVKDYNHIKSKRADKVKQNRLIRCTDTSRYPEGYSKSIEWEVLDSSGNKVTAPKCSIYNLSGNDIVEKDTGTVGIKITDVGKYKIQLKVNNTYTKQMEIEVIEDDTYVADLDSSIEDEVPSSTSMPSISSRTVTISEKNIVNADDLDVDFEDRLGKHTWEVKNKKLNGNVAISNGDGFITFEAKRGNNYYNIYEVTLRAKEYFGAETISVDTSNLNEDKLYGEYSNKELLKTIEIKPNWKPTVKISLGSESTDSTSVDMYNGLVVSNSSYDDNVDIRPKVAKYNSVPDIPSQGKFTIASHTIPPLKSGKEDKNRAITTEAIFAYTDEFVPIDITVTDENVAECKLYWIVRGVKKGRYTLVNEDNIDIKGLPSAGDSKTGKIKIKKNGLYELQCWVEDEGGLSAIDVMYIRVMSLPDASLQFNSLGYAIGWTTRENIEFDLSVTDSDSNTGDAYGEYISGSEIDHSKDWIFITPMSNYYNRDGHIEKITAKDDIHIMNIDGTSEYSGDTYFPTGENYIVIAGRDIKSNPLKCSITDREFKRDTNDCKFIFGYVGTTGNGKRTPLIWKEFTVNDDLPPDIKVNLKRDYYRDPTDGRAKIDLGISNGTDSTGVVKIESTQGDSIGNVGVEVVYDANNDGKYEETPTTVPIKTKNE